MKAANAGMRGSRCGRVYTSGIQSHATTLQPRGEFPKGPRMQLCEYTHAQHWLYEYTYRARL